MGFFFGAQSMRNDGKISWARRLRRACMVASLWLACGASQAAQWPASWSQPAQPFHIVGPVFYVGGAELTAYLVVDGECLMLINVGLETNAAMVQRSIETLGFKAQNLRHILLTQAHMDHAAGAAALRQLSGAEIHVGSEDVPLMQRGGRGDHLFGDALPFTPTDEVHGLDDGAQVRCGTHSLHTLATPGHTPGSRSWVLTLDDAAGTRVLFQGSVSLLYPERLRDNPIYPEVLGDFQRTFDRLATLDVEYVLPDHLQFARPEGTATDAAPEAGWFRGRAALDAQIKANRAKMPE